MTAKFKFLLTSIVIVITFSSCFTTRVSVGDVSPNQPMMKVNSVWNHHILWGLIPLDNASMRADTYIGDRTRYVIQTNQSFLNQLVSACTFGIYTPTTTTFYLPTNKADFDNLDEYKSRGKKYKPTVEDDIYRTQPIVKTPQKGSTTSLLVDEEDDVLVVVPRKSKETSTKLDGEQYVTESKVSKPTETSASTKSVSAPAEGYKATIYFKDGAKMDGIVTQESADDKIKIKLPSGLVIESQASEIEKIVKK